MPPSASAALTLAPPQHAGLRPLTLAGVVHEAPVALQLLLAGLTFATVAAVGVAIVKLASGRRLTGGSAFLSGLRLGGPLAGLVGAAYGGLNMAIGTANAGAVPADVLARGFAEVLLLILLGLVSGSIAVMGHWAVEARIDRAVLRA